MAQNSKRVAVIQAIASRARAFSKKLQVGGAKREVPQALECFFISKLPFELREIIWKECIGGMTFHLEIQDRVGDAPAGYGHGRRNPATIWYTSRRDLLTKVRLGRILCYSPTPESCDDNLGSGCDKYRGRLPEKSPACLLSILLTCRQVYFETLSILYSNRFVANQVSFVQYLPQLLHLPTINTIKVLSFKWYMRFNNNGGFREGVELDQWRNIWYILSKMEGLQHLTVTLCTSKHIWGNLFKTGAVEVAEPLRAVTWPREFVVNLPFECPVDKEPWVSLPCRIGKTPSEDSR